MSTADPFLPIQPDPAEAEDRSSDVADVETRAASEDVADEAALLAGRTDQQEEPPFRTPTAGDRLSEDQLDDELG